MENDKKPRMEGCLLCCIPPQAQISCPAAAVTATLGCSQCGWELGWFPHTPGRRNHAGGDMVQEVSGKLWLNSCSLSLQAACWSGQPVSI